MAQFGAIALDGRRICEVSEWVKSTENIAKTLLMGLDLFEYMADLGRIE